MNTKSHFLVDQFEEMKNDKIMSNPVQVLLDKIEHLRNGPCHDIRTADIIKIVQILKISGTVHDYQKTCGYFSCVKLRETGNHRCFETLMCEAIAKINDEIESDKDKNHEYVDLSELIDAVLIPKPTKEGFEHMEKFDAMCARLLKIDKESIKDGKQTTGFYELFIYAVVCVYYVPAYTRTKQLYYHSSPGGYHFGLMFQDFADVDYDFTTKDFSQDMEFILGLPAEKLRYFLSKISALNRR